MSEIPSSLLIGDNVIGTAVKQSLEFYNRDDYLLVEVFPNRDDRINLYQTRKAIFSFLDQKAKPVALRGYGFRGISTVVSIAHLMKMDEKKTWTFHFETFTAQRHPDKRKLTSLQIVMLPTI